MSDWQEIKDWVVGAETEQLDNCILDAFQSHAVKGGKRAHMKAVIKSVFRNIKKLKDLEKMPKPKELK